MNHCNQTSASSRTPLSQAVGSQTTISQTSSDPHPTSSLPPIDPRRAADEIRRTYRSRCEAEFGELSEEVAAEFITGSHVARLLVPARDAGPGEGEDVTVPAGSVVLAWPRGKNAQGERVVVAWHPHIGLDRLLHLRAQDVEQI